MNAMSFVILNMINEALTLIASLFAKSNDMRFVMTLSNPESREDMSFPGKQIIYKECKKMHSSRLES